MLDFQMKHEGGPPARLLARVQMAFTEAEIPKSAAKYFVPYLKTADDLDAKLIEDLQAAFDLLRMHELTDEETGAEIQKALEELKSKAGEGRAAGDDDDETDVKALSPILAQLITQLRAKGNNVPTPKPGPCHARAAAHGFSPRQTVIAMHSDALQSRLDRKHTPTIGRHLAGLSLSELAMSVVRAEGHRPFNMQEAVRMATHSTSDFPLVLGDSLGNTVARELEQVQPALMRAAHEIEALDYRGGNLLGLSASGMPEEVNEAGEIRQVTIDETGESKPSPRDVAAKFRISNKAIVNDDLGVFSQIGKMMIGGAIEKQRRILLEPLQANGGLGNTMSDGKAVFHADHGNLAASGAVLSVDSLSAARLALRGQRGKQGEYYAIEPWALVVPPALETQAQKVLAEINATKASDANPFSGTLEIIVEVGLTDPAAWYLIGNPARVDGLAYAYLEGQAAPRVESKPGWDTLGMEFRLVWALDARFVSWASWFKNPGA